MSPLYPGGTGSSSLSWRRDDPPDPGCDPPATLTAGPALPGPELTIPATPHGAQSLPGRGPDLITPGRLRLLPRPGGEEDAGEVPGLGAKPALGVGGERSAVTPACHSPVSFCKEKNLLFLSPSSLWSERKMENLISGNF